MSAIGAVATKEKTMIHKGIVLGLAQQRKQRKHHHGRSSRGSWIGEAFATGLDSKPGEQEAARGAYPD